MTVIYEGHTLVESHADLDVLPHLIPAGRTVPTFAQYAANNALFNVLDYAGGLAIYNGVVDSTAAWATCLGLAGAAKGLAYGPHGHYKVSGQFLVNYDDLTIAGDGQGTVFEPSTANILFLCSDGAPEAAHYRLTLRDFRIQAHASIGPASAGLVQLNNMRDFHVSGVQIAGLGAVSGLTDGFAAANGSYGTYTDCVVDGIGKSHFYQAAGCGHTQFIGCVARNQPTFNFGCGFDVGRGGAELIGCTGTNCANGAVLIYTSGAVPEAPVDVSIVGGSFNGNYRGIDIDSAFTPVPTNIKLIGVTCSNNTDMGIRAQYCTNLLISQPTCENNNSFGIYTGPGVTYARVVEPYMKQNSLTRVTGAAIYIQASQRVTVRGGHYIDLLGVPKQTYAILLENNGATNPNFIKLLDIENNVNGSNANGIAFAGGSVATGKFTWRDDTNTPEGNRAAPVSSIYEVNGAFHEKATGTGGTGWVKRSPNVLTNVTVNNVQTTIAHGLGYVPTDISFLLRADARVWRSAPPDATNIYLTANIAVACDISVR